MLALIGPIYFLLHIISAISMGFWLREVDSDGWIGGFILGLIFGPFVWLFILYELRK